MRNIEFVNGYFYHIYNRGVLKNNIFIDSADYARFVHCLYEFNNVLSIRQRHISRKLKPNGQRPALTIRLTEGELVDIICWCLMPNHFHLILRQKVDGGIRKFMHKVETSHAKSFNKKYNRTGVLYEGRFKATPIEKDEYLTHLSRYIHLNPLDLAEKGVDIDNFLENYKWSSYLDYIGKHNFPSILNKEPLGWYFKNPEEHKKFDLDIIEELILE